MRAYIIRRILQSFIVFAAILIIVFSMLQITGNPAAILMPLESTQEEIAAFSKEMGFDQPLPIQFAKFIFGVDTIDRLLIGRIQNIKTPDVDIGNAERVKTLGVIRGDFGFSYRHEIPAMGLVLEHFPNTVLLAFTAVIIAILISIPAGGGYGRPTLFFMLQALGILVSRTATGKWLGIHRGFRGWLFTLLVVVVPCPLVFHSKFASQVVVPFLETIGAA